MVAKGKVARWGNSLALRIPKSVAETAGLRDGDTVMIEVDREGVLAVKAMSRPPKLEDLISQITPENLHRETDWGEPAGNELW